MLIFRNGIFTNLLLFQTRGRGGDRTSRAFEDNENERKTSSTASHWQLDRVNFAILLEMIPNIFFRVMWLNSTDEYFSVGFLF